MAKKKAAKKKVTAKRRNRVMLPAVTKAIQQWTAALGSEMATWPKVSTKPMMGMTAYYVGKQIFAVLPKTRSFFADKGIGIRTEKFKAAKLKALAADGRTVSNPIGKKWASFEVDSAADLREAIRWLAEAYEAERTSG